MGPLIRAAEPADLRALHDLVERAYRGESARAGWTHEADLLGGQRTDAETLAEMLADPARLVLLAEADGLPVGCVELADRGGRLAYIGMLSVDPARQAAGLGRRLLDGAERAAAARFGAATAEMTVIRQRQPLIAWYERRGYRLTGETRPFPLDDPRFGVPLTRDLAFLVLAKRLTAID